MDNSYSVIWYFGVSPCFMQPKCLAVGTQPGLSVRNQGAEIVCIPESELAEVDPSYQIRGSSDFGF